MFIGLFLYIASIYWWIKLIIIANPRYCNCFSGDIIVIDSSSSDCEYNGVEPEDNGGDDDDDAGDDDDNDNDDDYDVISVRSDTECGSSTSSIIAETYGG